MNLLFKRMFLLIAISLLGTQPILAQQEESNSTDPVVLKKIADSISKDPNNSGLHERYLEASGFARYGAKDDPAFVKQYQLWLKEFPKSAIIPYALGHAYWNKESPAAKPFLLKALELDPKMDKAYFELWIDSDRWGKFKEGLEYLRKANELAPDNPDYAFYYALSFDEEPKKTERLIMDMVQRFPHHDRTRGAIFIATLDSKDFDTKEKYFELLKKNFPLERWRPNYMSDYYELLLMPETPKAIALVKEIQGVVKDSKTADYWNKQLVIAENIEMAKKLIREHLNEKAIKVMGSTQINKRSKATEDFLIMKAQAYKNINKTDTGYTLLLNYYSTNPSDKIKKQLYDYGTMLGKPESEVNKEVWAILDKNAQQATPFALKKYTSEGKMSLSDLKGKVVLLTYWFPGCGPCRGEFPHFQNVVDKFKGKDFAYVGINIVPEQNDYVLPFMKSSGYTFTPLEDFEGRDKGNLNNGGAAPVNFLIDKNGKIVFKNIRTDGSNEDVLENMISSLLNRT